MFHLDINYILILLKEKNNLLEPIFWQIKAKLFFNDLISNYLDFNWSLTRVPLEFFRGQLEFN